MNSVGEHPTCFLNALYIDWRLPNPDISDKASMVKRSCILDFKRFLKCATRCSVVSAIKLILNRPSIKLLTSATGRLSFKAKSAILASGYR